MMFDEPWTGSKRQRIALKDRFSGLCGYCGNLMTSMHADHMEPVIRIMTDPWGKKLSFDQQRMMRPDRNVVSNMMPSCAACNMHKGGYSIEQWRDLLGRSTGILERDNSTFRAARRFGMVTINVSPVVFYFEAQGIRGEALK